MEEIKREDNGDDFKKLSELGLEFPKLDAQGADLIINFDQDDAASETLEIDEDEIGKIHIKLSKDKTMHSMVFPDSSKRFKFESASLRYNQERSMFYIRFRRFLIQEFSLEVDAMDEEVMVDFDSKSRIIGFAVLNATRWLKKEVFAQLPDNEWIKVPIEGVEESIGPDDYRERKAKKVRKAQQPAPEPKNKPKKRVFVNLVPNPIPGLEDEPKNSFFRQKIVRDLVWVMNSPFILRNIPQLPDFVVNSTEEKKPDYFTDLPLVPDNWNAVINDPKFLQELDENPQEFYDWIKTKVVQSNNLGGYFSLLIQWWLLKCPNHDKLRVKFQLYKDKKTIGDLDFLFFDTDTNEWIHWEVGIKFYLLPFENTPAEGCQVFNGPHCTGDSLSKFIRKTCQQLQIRDDETAREKLQEEGVLPSRCYFFLKGYLFYPLTDHYYEQNNYNRAPQEFMNEYVAKYYSIENTNLHPNHCKGWWNQFKYLSVEGDERIANDVLLLETNVNDVKKAKLEHSRWIILTKADFMTEIYITPDRVNDYDLLDYAQLKLKLTESFQRNYRGVFLSELIPWDQSRFKGEPNPAQISWVEASRGIIVSDKWPDPIYANKRYFNY